MRPISFSRFLVAFGSSVAIGCAPSQADDDATASSSGAGAAAAGSSSSGFGTASGSSGTGGDVCEPPDMLIALDRTLTMHFQPDGTDPIDAPSYASSKWSQAIGAIEGLVDSQIDQTIRFGLELWPKEEPGCITLAERVENTKQATNPFCEDGEIVLPPALGSSGAIEAALDPLTTKICISTPTGAGLLTASSELAQIKASGRDQYILLVTDGADWDQSCPTPDPVTVTQELAAAGVKTFVLGFSATGDIMPGGVGAPFLNDMACAGMTAPNFATACEMDASGGYVAVDPTGPTLYLQASDATALATALHDVAAQVCCDCVQ
jgi:hypothetical protein